MSNITPASNNKLAQANAFDDGLQAALQMPIKERPYTAKITRAAPTAFVFLLDQSGSMAGEMQWKSNAYSKAAIAAYVLNTLVDQLVERAMDGNDVKDYYKIAGIGYGGTDSYEANYCWQGNLQGKDWVTLAELRANKTVSFNALKVNGIDKQGWIPAIAGTLTPMKSAMQKAYTLLQTWIAMHKGKDCFPPTVINITDGEASDAENIELIQLANSIKELHTIDGNVLFFNININDGSTESITFPTKRDELPDDENAHLLYAMSSEMPRAFYKEISNYKKIDVQKQYVAMAYNAGSTELIQFMNIGTSQTKENLSKNG